METSRMFLMTIIFLISIFAFSGVVGVVANVIRSTNSDVSSEQFNYYLKNYDGKLVFEFAYTGEVDTGTTELRGIKAKDLKVVALGPNGKKTYFSFDNDIEPLKIIQVKVPEDTLDAKLIYKGKII